MLRLRRPSLFALVLALALAAGTAAGVWAGFRDGFTFLTGFSHTSFYGTIAGTWERDDTLPTGNQSPGKQLAGKPVWRSAPVIAEVDGNTGNGNEVVVGGQDGLLYAYHRNGSLLWVVDIKPAACTIPAGDQVLNSSPAVGDLDNNGIPEVVVGYGTTGVSDCDGGVVAVRGNTGSLYWRYSLRNLTNIPENASEALFGVVSTPGLADTDGDGRLEVGFGGFDRRVHLLNYDGTQRWYFFNWDTVWSSPAFMDINGDGRLELIIGTDISEDSIVNPAQAAGGFVYAFDTQSRTPKQTANREAGAYLWQTYFPQAIFSSPAIGDVLPDNPGLEIVIGGGCFFPIGSSAKTNIGTNILRPSDGAVLKTLTASACSMASPALADVDGDGKLEVISMITGRTDRGGDGFSKVVLWNPEGSTSPAATFAPQDPFLAPGQTDPGSVAQSSDDIRSVVIADLDGNKSLEIIVANRESVNVLKGDLSGALTCQSTACGGALSMSTWHQLWSSPAVGDLDGDGDLEVVIGAGHNYDPNRDDPNKRGYLYIWTNFAGVLNSAAGASGTAYAAPWPMWRGGAARDGRFATPVLSTPSAQLHFYQTTGNAAALQGTLIIRNTGGGTLNWTAAPGAGITLSATSGATTSQTTLTVSYNAAGGAAAGVTSLGTITLTTSNGLGGPQTVTLQRYVGPVLFLGQIQRQ